MTSSVGDLRTSLPVSCAIIVPASGGRGEPYRDGRRGNFSSFRTLCGEQRGGENLIGMGGEVTFPASGRCAGSSVAAVQMAHGDRQGVGDVVLKGGLLQVEKHRHHVLDLLFGSGAIPDDRSFHLARRVLLRRDLS